MVRHTKNPRHRLLRRHYHHYHLRESSSEDELQAFFSGSGSLPRNDSTDSLKDKERTTKDNKDDLREAQPEVSSWNSGMVLSGKQMEHLATSEYEYNAAAGSLLEKAFMQRFWCWATTFVPISVMPCTITAIGFALNLVTSSILIYYSPGATQPVPAWTLYLAALGVFLYQTADALDGKQCYKIQNSQIEEFYDHACDSVSTILLMYSVAISIQMGTNPALLILLVYMSLVAFWSTHWQCYVTKQMIFGHIDVTEAQFVMIGTHLASAVFGQQIWGVEFGGLITTGSALALATLATLFRSIWINCGIVLLSWETPLESVGALPICRRRQSARLTPLLPLTVLTLLLALNYALLLSRQQSLDTLQLVTFVLTFGATMAKLTMALVLAHCTEVDAQLFDIALAPLTVQAAFLYLLGDALISSYHFYLCLITLAANCVILGRFFVGVGCDMERALGVRIFSLTYPPGHPKNRTSHKGIYINGLNNAALLAHVHKPLV